MSRVRGQGARLCKNEVEIGGGAALIPDLTVLEELHEVAAVELRLRLRQGTAK